MYIYVCLHMYIHMYVCLHECVCMCVCMYTYTITVMYVWYVYLNLLICSSIHPSIYSFIDFRILLLNYSCIYLCNLLPRTSICQIGFVSIYIYHFYNQSNLIDLRVQKANRYMSEYITTYMNKQSDTKIINKKVNEYINK